MLLVVENSVFDLELSHKGQDNTVKGAKTFFFVLVSPNTWPNVSEGFYDVYWEIASVKEGTLVGIPIIAKILRRGYNAVQ